LFICAKLRKHTRQRGDNRRHFPTPWSVEEQEQSFVIKDASGQIIGSCSFGNELTRSRFWPNENEARVGRKVAPDAALAILTAEVLADQSHWS